MTTQTSTRHQRHRSQPIPLFADWPGKTLTGENQRIQHNSRHSTDGKWKLSASM